MGYDRELADRIRELVAGAEGVAEHVDAARPPFTAAAIEGSHERASQLVGRAGGGV